MLYYTFGSALLNIKCWAKIYTTILLYKRSYLCQWQEAFPHEPFSRKRSMQSPADGSLLIALLIISPQTSHWTTTQTFIRSSHGYLKPSTISCSCLIDENDGWIIYYNPMMKSVAVNFIVKLMVDGDIVATSWFLIIKE